VGRTPLPLQPPSAVVAEVRLALFASAHHASRKAVGKHAVWKIDEHERAGADHEVHANRPRVDHIGSQLDRCVVTDADVAAGRRRSEANKVGELVIERSFTLVKGRSRRRGLGWRKTTSRPHEVREHEQDRREHDQQRCRDDQVSPAAWLLHPSVAVARSSCPERYA
jgi:hypothetical protein